MALHDPPRDPSRGRIVYRAFGVFYALLFVAMIWPIYPRFATIEPRILEMPHSLAYVVFGLVLSFAALLGLYLWERSGEQPDGWRRSGARPDDEGSP